MAHPPQFTVFAFGIAGPMVFVSSSGIFGGTVAVMLWLVGGAPAQLAFKRLATPNQVEEDLRSRADAID